MKKKKTNK